MDISKIQPIQNEPALFIKEKKILVIADLHIGIESELKEHGVNTESQTQKILNHFISICKKHKPETIIILGDIKHNIPTSTIQERNDVKNFLNQIKDIAKVYIVPGNHDGNIAWIKPEEITIQPSDGFCIENVGFVHGHRWPSKQVISSDQVITAHTHPTIMLTDRLEHKTFEPCWIKGKFIKKKIEEKYKIKSNAEVLFIPAFNPLCGGIAVNKDGIMGPIGKLLEISELEIYLLDGTSLGAIKNL